MRHTHEPTGRPEKEELHTLMKGHHHGERPEEAGSVSTGDSANDDARSGSHGEATGDCCGGSMNEGAESPRVGHCGSCG